MIRGTRKLNKGPSLAVKKYVNQKIQRSLETKFLPRPYDETPIASPAGTPVNSALTIIQQGTDANQRVGNQIHVTGWYGQLTFTGSLTDDFNTIRCLIYSPKDPSVTLTGIEVYDNIDLDQFNVYYDKLFTVSKNGGPFTRNLTLRKKFNKGNRQGKKVQYYGSGSTDYASGPMFLYVVSDSLAVSHPIVTGHLRVYYKDA